MTTLDQPARVQPHWRALAAAIVEICDLPPGESSRLAHVLLQQVNRETHPEISAALDAGDARTAAELFVGSHDVLPLGRPVPRPASIWLR